MKNIILFILVLLFTGPANAFEYEVQLRYEFKDPDSVKFKEIEVYLATDGTTSVCGRLNGKNSYGGYIGYTKFVYFSDLKVLILETDYPLAGIQSILDLYCIPR